MVLEKLIYNNPAFQIVIDGIISEFDIKSAGSTAMREIYGDELYNELMSMDKLQRNIKIGLIMRDTPGLSEKVNSLMLKYLNKFIEINDIKQRNIIMTTRDSIVLYNKIPLKTTFNNVEFRNKEGMFSSFYRLGSRLIFFFDSMRNDLIVKGVSQEIVKESQFVNIFVKKYLFMFESMRNNGLSNTNSLLTKFRTDYIESKDINIYKELLNENSFAINIENGGEKELVYMKEAITGITKEDLSIESNYVNIMMPLMRCVSIN